MKKILLSLIVLLHSHSLFALNIDKPDVVILTKNLASLPHDVVKHTLFSKIFTEEQIFKYEEEPTYLELNGFLRRLAYEQNLSVKEDILKFFLSTNSEIAIWKDESGRLGHYQMLIPVSTVKKIFLTFILDLAKLAGDSQATFSEIKDEKKVKINLISKEIYLYLGSEYLSLSTFDPNLSTKELKEKIQSRGKDLFGKVQTTGVYSSLMGQSLKDETHAIYLDSKFLTLNYQYFFPSFKGFIANFSEKKWNYYSIVGGNKVAMEVAASEIWKLAPRNPALCFAVPLETSRIGEMLSFKETIKSDDGKEIEKLTNEFQAEELISLQASPVGVCWYSQSHLLTPIFFFKPKKLVGMEVRISKMFNDYVGMYEYEDEGKNLKFPIEEKKIKDGMILVRQVSSPGGNYKSPDVIPAHKYDNFFKVTLLYLNESIVFSADDKLVHEAEMVITKKSPSLYDEMKNEKEMNFVAYPQKLSSLVIEYINNVLSHSPNAVFKTTTSHFFEKSSLNLQGIPAFGFELSLNSSSKELIVSEINVKDIK